MIDEGKLGYAYWVQAQLMYAEKQYKNEEWIYMRKKR